MRVTPYFLILIALILGVTPGSSAATTTYSLIVNPKNQVARMDRKVVKDIFLKKMTFFPNGKTISPVDLNVDSKTRQKFSDEVIGRSVSAVKNYWQQMIFSGRDVPPPELESDEAVIAYVRKNPNAIGYISSSARPAGVKIIAIE